MVQLANSEICSVQYGGIGRLNVTIIKRIGRESNGDGNSIVTSTEDLWLDLDWSHFVFKFSFVIE